MFSSQQRKRAEKTARLFSLLASGTRISILETIQKGKTLSVQSIADELSMTHSAVSHQLGLLAESGVVSYVKDGREMHYSVGSSKEAKALVKVLKAFS